MDNDLHFSLIKPEADLENFVESFWFLRNQSIYNKEIIILPDGRIDLTFSQSSAEPFHITRSGLETQPAPAIIAPGITIFAISFKLPAIEYIFHKPVAGLLDYAEHLPDDFWNFDQTDLQNFDLFCKKATQKIRTLLPKEMDSRKQELFNLVYASKGNITVQQLAEKVYWSSRQINRYFNQQFGLPLKTYCNILRFKTSLEQLALGRLFPESHFTDQSHFIKEIKKFSGVIPKDLLKNKNDRFIQFSVLSSK